MKMFLPLDTMTLHCDSGSRHDFPRLARESGFSFNLYRGRVDWTKIGTIDVDKIVRERDLETLQDVLSCVMACSLNSEYDLKVLDPNFIKIFQLAQLGSDFLLYCRNYLDHCVTVMQEQLRVALQEIEHLRKLKQQNSEEISNLQKKLKARSKSTRSSNSSPVSIVKCLVCEKVFVGEQYLQAHQQRRHPELSNSEPFHNNQNKEVDNLQQQVRDLQDRLRVTEEALKKNHESSTPDVAVLQAILQSELQKIKSASTQTTPVEVASSDSSLPQQNLIMSGNQIKLDMPVEPLQVANAQAGSQVSDIQCMSQLSLQENPKPELTQTVSLVWVEQQNDEIKALKEQLWQQNQAHELVMQRKLEELQRQHRADLEDLRLSIMKSRGSGDHIIAARNDVPVVGSPQSLYSQGTIQAWDQPISKTVRGSKEGGSTPLKSKNSIVDPRNPAVISSDEKSAKLKEETVVQEEYVSPDDPESSDSSSQTPSPHPASPLHTDVKTKQGEKSLAFSSLITTKNVDAPDLSKSMYAKSSSSNSGSTSDTGNSSYDSESRSSNSEEESSPKGKESSAVELTPQVLNGLKEDLLNLLNRRLRELGVDPEWSGLPVASFHSNMSTVKHHQNITAKSQHNYFGIQEALMKEVDKRVAEHLKLQQPTPILSRTKENRAAGSVSIFARIKSHVKSKLSPAGQSSRISKYPKKSATKVKTGDLVENVYSQAPSTSSLKSLKEYQVLQNKSMEAETSQPSNLAISEQDDDIEYSHVADPSSSSKPVTVSAKTTNEDPVVKTKPISPSPSTTDVKVYSRSMYANLNRSDIEVEKRDLASDSSSKQPVQVKTSTPIKSNSEVPSRFGAGKPFISSDIESISEVESDLHDIVENTSEKLTATVNTRPHTTLTTAELLANVAKFRQNSGQLNATQSIVKSNLKSSLSTGNIMKKKVVFRDEKDGFNTIELGPAQISHESLTPHRSLSENSLVMTHSPQNSEQPVPQPRSSLMHPAISAASTNTANTDSDEDWDWDGDSSDTLTVKKTEVRSPGSNSGGLSFSNTKRSGLNFSSTSMNKQHESGSSGDEHKVADLVKDIERKLQNKKNKPAFGVSIAGPKPSELATTRPFSSLGNYPSTSAAPHSFGSLQEDKLSDLLLDDISSS